MTGAQRHLYNGPRIQVRFRDLSSFSLCYATTEIQSQMQGFQASTSGRQITIFRGGGGHRGSESSSDGEQSKTAPNAAASETQADNLLLSASEMFSSVISAREQKNWRAQFNKRHKTAQHTNAEVLGKFDLFLDHFLLQLTTWVYL